MAYAKLHILNEVKQTVAKTEEYRKAEDEVTSARTRYEMIAKRYEDQARQLRSVSSSEVDFKNRMEELQKRAGEELDPAMENLDEARRNLEKVERRMVPEYIYRKVIDELSMINDILQEVKIENVQSEKPIQRGKLGLAGVLNLRFQTDKKTLKELRKRIEKTPFKKVEIFIETT